MPKTAAILENKAPLGSDDICEAVGRSFDRSFERLGANRKSVTSTFEAALVGLRKAKDPEMRLRSIAKSAALSTGRCHGNVVETGRCILDQLEALAEKHSFKQDLARDQVLLGIAEGACQLGPVVYCRFLEIANTYKEGADEWIARNRRLPALVESFQLPVIVPYENDLTLQPQVNEPSESSNPSETKEVSEAKKAETPAEETKTELNWSRPQKPGFFRRLTDAVGHFFGN